MNNTKYYLNIPLLKQFNIEIVDMDDKGALITAFMKTIHKFYDVGQLPDNSPGQLRVHDFDLHKVYTYEDGTECDEVIFSYQDTLNFKTED